MKRLIFYGAALALIAMLGWMPFSPSDVADLKPVELIYIDAERGPVLVKTDTGGSGRGQTLAEAFQDLKQTTAGNIFLETADHLIVSEKARPYLQSAVRFLRPACNVCVADREPELETAAAFLRTHEPNMTLQDFRTGIRDLPKLRSIEGRMYLVE